MIGNRTCDLADRGVAGHIDNDLFHWKGTRRGKDLDMHRKLFEQLVGGLDHLFIALSWEELIFFRGVETTSQIWRFAF